MKRRLEGLLDLRDRMNQLFDELMHPQEQAGRGVWTPLADVSEIDDGFVIALELPGVKPGEVEVEVGPDGRTVWVRGRRPYPGDPPEAVHRMERHYGPFARAIDVTAPVRPETVERRYLDGVLTLTLRRAA